jgi:8-oxo-dGTP pyrophosphatase MutT (NUDIX family)
MSDDHELFRYLLSTGEHRPSGRAIVFDSSRQHILVEKNSGAREGYVGFPGGGIALAETLEECITREFHEEFGGAIGEFEFLFLVENFIPFEGELLHGIELFCEVKLKSDDVRSQLNGYEFPWIPISGLSDVDLRPSVVRDRIVDGSYRKVRHLISRR